MVLEPGQRLAGPFTLEQHVTDHPPLPGDRVQRQQPDPGQLLARHVPIETPEQLVAATHREKCSPRLCFLVQRGRLLSEVAGDERLLAVLAASDVVQVDLACRHRLVHADRAHVELVAAQPGALGQHRDVPAVGVDVQVVRVEVADPDSHAALSQ